MHLCPRCGTTLSNFEVAQGYKDIDDIAVTVKLPLRRRAGHFSSYMDNDRRGRFPATPPRRSTPMRRM